MKTIYWSKGVFSSTYHLYSNGIQIGKFQSKTWSSDAISTVNGKHLTFKTKGFFSQSTLIVDNDINRIVGRITYNNWRTIANIELDDTTAELKSDNIWSSRWRLKDKHTQSVLYKGSTTKGTIHFTDQNDKLIIAGLYVRHYFKQKSVALFIAIFLPLYVTLFT